MNQLAEPTMAFDMPNRPGFLKTKVSFLNKHVNPSDSEDLMMYLES